MEGNETGAKGRDTPGLQVSLALQCVEHQTVLRYSLKDLVQSLQNYQNIHYYNLMHRLESTENDSNLVSYLEISRCLLVFEEGPRLSKVPELYKHKSCC